MPLRYDLAILRYRPTKKSASALDAFAKVRWYCNFRVWFRPWPWWRLSRRRRRTLGYTWPYGTWPVFPTRRRRRHTTACTSWPIDTPVYLHGMYARATLLQSCPLARHRSIESSIVGRLVRLPASIRLFGIPCSCTSLCSVSPTIYPQPTDQPHNYIFIPNHGPPSRSLLSLPKEQTLH